MLVIKTAKVVYFIFLKQQYSVVMMISVRYTERLLVEI